MSLQAETCKNIKITVERKLDSKAKVIGVISDNPTVGKSVTAANLALFIAQSGSKCLLIDGDLRKPTLTDDNFTNVNRGLLSVLSKRSSLDEAIIHDTKTNLFILAAELKDGAQASSISTSGDMKELIENCRKSFDYIIIDLPPLSAASDASFFSQFVDFFLLVLEWGKSKPNSLNFSLKINDIAKDKILGAVLSQADMQSMEKNYGHTIHREYTRA